MMVVIVLSLYRYLAFSKILLDTICVHTLYVCTRVDACNSLCNGRSLSIVNLIAALIEVCSMLLPVAGCCSVLGILHCNCTTPCTITVW